MAEVIKCELYDYFELACMRRSTISLELHDGQTIAGVASNLETKDGKEFLLLTTGDRKRQVDLMQIDVLVFSNSGERVSIS
ncbi:MAG: Rho-binding antiterminator [Arenicella sp.]